MSCGRLANSGKKPLGEHLSQGWPGDTLMYTGSTTSASEESLAALLLQLREVATFG